MDQISRSRRGTQHVAAARSNARGLNGVSPEVLLLGILCLVAVGLRLWPIGSYSTDYDEGVYWQSLRALAQGHTLYGQIFGSQPPLFLLSLYPFYVLFGQTLVAARLGVVVYSLVGLIALYFAARAIGGRWMGVAACALLATDPLYLKESHTLQAEVPALAFEIACVAFAVMATQRMGRWRRTFACLSGVMLGLGVMTKLVDVVAIIPAALYLAMPIYQAFVGEDKQLQWSTRHEVWAHVRRALPDFGLFAAGAVVACALALLPFAGHWGDLYDQVVRFHVAAGHADNRGLVYNVKMLLRVRQPGVPSGHLLGEYLLILLALAAVVMGIRRRSWLIVPPLLWAAASLALLLQQQPLFDHHRVLLSPPLALLGALIIPLAAPSAARDAQPLPQSKQMIWVPTSRIARIVAVSIAVVTLASLGAGILDVREAAQPIPYTERQIASALRAETLPQDQIVTDNQYIAGLADRTVLPQLVDTSQVRIDSGYLTAQQLESVITKADARVILFASGRFDRVPGFRAWVSENYVQVADFGDGRVLYMKESSGPPIV